ncbi:MAG: HIT family protein [Candidatus Lokiarchaeota archaeon]
MNHDDCIFCKIVKGEIPSKIIYEDETNIAFLDIFPVSKGHTIVIPKEHYKNLETLPDEEITELFMTVKKVAINIHEKLKIDGYNIVQNNFPAAGQAVDHTHIHIIPRNEGDNKIKLNLPKKQAPDSELDEVFKKLKM